MWFYGELGRGETRCFERVKYGSIREGEMKVGLRIWFPQQPRASLEFLELLPLAAAPQSPAMPCIVSLNQLSKEVT